MIRTERICDVCGRDTLYLDFHTVKIEDGSWNTTSFPIFQQKNEREFDICTDCIDKFKEFVRLKRG